MPILPEPKELGTAVRFNTVLHPGYLERFFVRKFGDLILIHVEDIVHLEAGNAYSRFANGQRFLVPCGAARDGRSA